MNVKARSQRAFAAVTLLTVASVAMVLVVYAALLGTMLNPGSVFLGSSGSVVGTVKYSPNNTDSWADSQSFGSAAADWYARVELQVGYYHGPVTFTWKLQLKTGVSPDVWTDVAGAVHTNSITLDDTTSTIYTSGAVSTGNYNWKTDVAGQSGTYRVVVTVDSA